MIADVLATFIILFVQVYNILIIARVLSSWVVPDLHSNKITAVIFDLTEPLLAPVRSLLPKSQFLDLAPLVTFFLLQGLLWYVPRLLLGMG